MLEIESICRRALMVPVLTIRRLDEAVPLARALVAGGLPVLEITLRTSVAFDAIQAIRAECPDSIVGAGTLRTSQDVQKCIDAGAEFGVSPGAPRQLMEAVAESGFPFLPGCASPTEVMHLADQGFSVLKFFPAEAAGGVAMLKALAAPFPDILFCPTGGVSLRNAIDYLSLPNTVTVGGSWVTPDSLIDRRDWEEIERLARETTEKLRNQLGRLCE